ncbi:MAG: alginate export family protein [Candidatus Ferrigenium altingense]
MLLKKHPISSIAALSALLFAQSALAADTLTDALTGGKASANLQYRYEDVRTGAAAANTATAHTVRLRLGYETATFNGFGAMVEAESVKDLGNKKYDSKATGQTANGYAVIADPEATEINQAYLSYSGIANTTVKFGRQRIKLDNDRFIGNVGWRQNEQTFDAFTLINKSLPNTTITAGYITNVNRVFSDSSATPTSGAFGGNHKMSSTILNANYKGWSFAEVVGYAYLLDYDVATAFTTNSSDTYGLRLNGSTAMGGNKVLYTAEFAEQRSAHGNATNYKTSYTLLEGGVDVTNIAVFKLGYEVLGSDTGAANTQFKTPLATLHAFNGWADMFLATPNQGLKDTYVSANTKLAGFGLGAVYHDYRTDVTTAALTNSNLGKEWNLVATYPFNKNTLVGLKYADYKAGTNNAAALVNTQKTWLWGEFKF